MYKNRIPVDLLRRLSMISVFCPHNYIQRCETHEMNSCHTVRINFSPVSVKLAMVNQTSRRVIVYIKMDGRHRFRDIYTSLEYNESLFNAFVYASKFMLLGF